MSRFLKFLKYFGLSILILFLFRGCLFRATINYSKIGSRTKIQIINPRLITELQKENNNQILSLSEILDLSRKITNKTLRFTTGPASNDPNVLYDTQKANCIGYAALFSSIADYLITNQSEENNYRSSHIIGKLDFWGIDLHQFLDHPFFKDHDYVMIENIQSKEQIYIDPSVSDYLWIHTVKSH